jgi:glycosyltransferase involved in cell wall biosynthesis
MKRKIKILFVNEFSQLSTGFSTYARYLLPKLYESGKFEIAEHSCYINLFHPEIDNVPWKVYPNEPDPRNPAEKELYSKNKLNQFGLWKFDEICLDFCPDAVFSIRDPWSDNWIVQSPYRKHFKYIHMPTCDGEPQKPEWLEFYKQCDRILTYSHWAKEIIEKSTGNQVKVFDVATAGPDLELFRPMNKKELRKKYMLPEEAFIIGTVMRNQPRKLFPELFQSFVKFLEICKKNNNHELAKKTFLYCHTSNPDVGWDINTELKRYKISHKVLFTYNCQNCGHVHVSQYQGDITTCPKCFNKSATLPNTMYGVSRETLAEIHNLFDLYIQFSVCEGQGMPINDSKSCGVPVMATEHSAMTEQVYNGGGIPIKIGRMFQESLAGTNQWRSLPDNDDCAQKIYNFFNAPQEYRDNLGKEARECVEKHYNWDLISQIWINAFESLEYPDQSQTWFGPPKYIQPRLNIPPNLSNEQFVEYCYRHVLQEPYFMNLDMAQRAIAALNLGYEPGQDANGQHVKNPFNRELLVQNMLNYVNHKNHLENIRYERLVNKNTGNRKGYIEI